MQNCCRIHIVNLEGGADPHAGDPLWHGFVAGPGKWEADCSLADQLRADLVATGAGVRFQAVVTQ